MYIGTNYTIDENCYDITQGVWELDYVEPLIDGSTHDLPRSDECTRPAIFLVDGKGRVKYQGDTPGETGNGTDGKTYIAYDNTMFRDLLKRFFQGEDIYNEMNQVCTTFVTDMSFLSFDENFIFLNKYGLEFDFPQLITWDVSNVTNMLGMFYSLNFNHPIPFWELKSLDGVIDFYGIEYSPLSYMFGYSFFNQDISQWDVSNIITMKLLFTDSPFNQDISSWDVSSVTNMKGMFTDSQFNQDISQWDVSSVTNMEGMFSYSPFNQDISSWNVSSVTNMEGMFEGSSFNQDISSWDVSNVTDIGWMFSYSQFNQDISSWDVSSVTSCYDFATECPICGTPFMPNFTNCTSGC